jgi:hypothetical protein
LFGTIVLVLCGATLTLAADEGLSEVNTEHFAELRRRGLHRVAEAEIEHRLTWPRLSSNERTALVLELAETLLAHARQLGESQRVSLWERIREVIRAQVPNETAAPRLSLLELQLVLVDREEAEACRRLVTITPWNQPSRQRGLQAATEGLNRLRRLETTAAKTARGAAKSGLTAPGSTVSGPTAAPSTQRIRLQVLQGELQSCEAELLPEGSNERAARLVAARQLLQPLVEQRAEGEQAERARVLLARVLRLSGDTREARRWIEAARRQSRHPNIRDSLTREETECRLAEDDLPEARRLIEQLSLEAERAAEERRESWDNRLLAARVWIACWRTGMKSQSRLASRDFAAAEEILHHGVQAAPGEWRELFVWLGESLQEERALGPELAAVSLQIQQALAEGDDQQADHLLARGAALALRRGLRDRAAEWGIQRGSLALERHDWGAAAQDLLTVAREFPSHAKAAEAQLLGAYALGRQWRARPSDDVRNEYRAALEQFCTQFTDDSGRPEVEWMLGELSRFEGHLGEAANHYDRIPRGHPRSSGAVRALAELTVQQIRNRKLDPAEQDLLRERLWGRVPPEPEVLGTDDLPVALALAELELTRPQPTWPRVDELLQRVESALASDRSSASETADKPEAKPAPTASTDTAAVWRLRILAASARSRWEEVDRRTQDPAPVSVRQLLELLEQLSLQAQTSTPSQRGTDSSGPALRRISQLLESRQTECSPEEQVRFQLLLARRAVLNNQPAEARARFERAVELAPAKDPAALEYAWFLIGLADAESKQAGVAWLVRRERHWKAGSEEWLSARIEVMKGLQRVGRSEEACRLLKSTRLLYPKTGTPAQVQAFNELRMLCP